MVVVKLDVPPATDDSDFTVQKGLERRLPFELSYILADHSRATREGEL